MNEVSVNPLGSQDLPEDESPSFGGQAELMAAICKCMLAIGKIGKEGRNAHANYDFASIDDFLAITSQACGANGIVVLQQEVECGTVEVNNRAWVKMVFDFIVCHSSGQVLPPVRRSVDVMWVGSQSYGSAQSYALKQFLRSLFQIACGDNDDPDFQAHVSAKQPSDTPIFSNVVKSVPKPAKKATAKKPAKKAAAKPVVSKDTVTTVEATIDDLDWFFFDKAAFWRWISNYLGKTAKEMGDVDLLPVCKALNELTPDCKWESRWARVHMAMLGVERPGQPEADKQIEETFGDNPRLVTESDIDMLEGLAQMTELPASELGSLLAKRYDVTLEKLSFSQACEFMKAIPHGKSNEQA